MKLENNHRKPGESESDFLKRVYPFIKQMDKNNVKEEKNQSKFQRFGSFAIFLGIIFFSILVYIAVELKRATEANEFAQRKALLASLDEYNRKVKDKNQAYENAPLWQKLFFGDVLNKAQNNQVSRIREEQNGALSMLNALSGNQAAQANAIGMSERSMNAANAANEWAGFNLPQPIYNQQKAYAENSNLELWKQHEANLRLSQLESQARVAAASIASQSRAGQAPNASAHINSLKQLLTQRQQVALYLSAIKDPGQRRILEDNLNKIDAVIRHNATALGIPIEQAQTLVPSTQTTKINPP